jgi:hypothetical protein
MTAATTSRRIIFTGDSKPAGTCMVTGVETPAAVNGLIGMLSPVYCACRTALSVKITQITTISGENFLFATISCHTNVALMWPHASKFLLCQRPCCLCGADIRPDL